MGWHNNEGYFDPTATAASMRRTIKPSAIKPLPPKTKVYDITLDSDEGKPWEVFLHFRGFHNPHYGIWVKVKAFNEQEARVAAMLQTVTDKPVEVAFCLRRY